MMSMPHPIHLHMARFRDLAYFEPDFRYLISAAIASISTIMTSNPTKPIPSIMPIFMLMSIMSLILFSASSLR